MDESKNKPRGPDGHLRCENCGYDLHSNASGQCPECGAGSDALRMPPQWRILITALGIPCVVLLVWLAWSLILRMGGA